MSRIPPETIEQIIAANDVVDVVGGYIQLKKAGTVYKAVCPFHQERTPSFTVNPQRQIFKCFGCGAGGNVIRFVMNYENLDFLSAAKKLAERANIKIEQSEMSAEDAARYSMRRRLLSLHAEAAEFFHFQLMKKPSAQIARDYLKTRGISSDVARSWQIGYAPNTRDAMRNFGHDQGYSDEELVASGLLKAPDEDRPYGGFWERFQGRLMFPICDVNSNVIAFSGRVLEKDAKGGKYVNSPETMLFSKGNVFFGLHKSMRAIIDKSSAIVCEGQLDLITAFEHGIQNVIAPQGTAFTEKQAHIVKRYASEVVLCFDADNAGQGAVAKSLPHLLAENLTIRVVEMPAGEDPDSMIRNHGADAFIARVKGAKDFFDFQIEKLASEPEFATPRGKVAAARKMAEWISLIKDAVLREMVIHKMTTRLEISAQQFVQLLKAPAPPKPADEPLEASTKPQAAPLDETIRILLFAVLKDISAREFLLEEPWDQVLTDDPGEQLLAKTLAAEYDPSAPASINAFLTTLTSEEEAQLSELLSERSREQATTYSASFFFKDGQTYLGMAQHCWKELQRRQIRRRMDALKARQRNPSLSAEEQASLHEQVVALTIRLKSLGNPSKHDS